MKISKNIVRKRIGLICGASGLHEVYDLIFKYMKLIPAEYA